MKRSRGLAGLIDVVARGLFRVHRWRSYYYRCVNVRQLVLAELQTRTTLSWRKRFRWWRRGFLSQSHSLYNLDQNDWREYLSDTANIIGCYRLNGKLYQVLNDKLAFYQALGAFPEVVPETHVLFDAFGARFLDPQTQAACDGDVIKLVADKGKLALKPTDGDAGSGFAILEYRDKKFFRNASTIEPEALSRYFRGLNAHILGEFVNLHPELAAIFPETANTLKILTMWDYDVPEPFIGGAIHRMGSRDSYPLDTWSKGGLCARVDVKSGRLGTAIDKRLHAYDAHPDTGATINGATVPDWESVKTKLLTICRHMPNFHYVAWDVILTEDGMRILEGNNRTSVDLLQLDTPLLRDDRVRRFYETRGVIQPQPAQASSQ